MSKTSISSSMRFKDQDEFLLSGAVLTLIPLLKRTVLRAFQNTAQFHFVHQYRHFFHPFLPYLSKHQKWIGRVPSN